MTQEGLVQLILAERERQDAKWGEQNHDPMTWIPILLEEVGEASKGAVEGAFRDRVYYLDYFDELVHVAAVALAMLECFERNKRSYYERETGKEIK